MTSLLLADWEPVTALGKAFKVGLAVRLADRERVKVSVFEAHGLPRSGLVALEAVSRDRIMLLLNFHGLHGRGVVCGCADRMRVCVCRGVESNDGILFSHLTRLGAPSSGSGGEDNGLYIGRYVGGGKKNEIFHRVGQEFISSTESDCEPRALFD